MAIGITNTSNKDAREFSYVVTKSYTIPSRDATTNTLNFSPVEYSGYYLFSVLSSLSEVGSSSDPFGYFQVFGLNVNAGGLGYLNKINPDVNVGVILHLNKNDVYQFNIGSYNLTGSATAKLTLLRLD